MVLFSHGWLWDLWARVGFGKTGRKGKGSGCLGDVAGACAGQLVGVNEEAPVGVARVDGEHPVVDVLLGALRLVARSQQPTGAVGGQAGLQPGCLSVVVVAVRGAKVALGSNPVDGACKLRAALRRQQCTIP